VSKRYAEEVVAELEKGTTRVGHDQDGNAVVSIEVEEDEGTRLVPVAKIIPLPVVSRSEGDA